MNVLPWASSGDILRAHDKNQFYARQLETRLTETCNGFLGLLYTLLLFWTIGSSPLVARHRRAMDDAT
jgi:hypothetical protein